MYIAPNTNVWFIKNVQLDPGYENTIYFTSRSEQETYFSEHRKFTKEAQSYMEPNKNIIRVKCPIGKLYDCNYMAFRNVEYGQTFEARAYSSPLRTEEYIDPGKMFYAFITSVNYVNNEVSEVHFEIDVIQTWHFDYTLKDCFIDREHTAYDGKYANTVPECLDLGDEYLCYDHRNFNMNKRDQSDVEQPMGVCVLVNRKVSGQSAQPSSYLNGVYTSTRIELSYDASQHDQLDQYLNQFVEDDIIAIYQYPAILKLSPGETTWYWNFEIPRAGKEFISEIGDNNAYTAKNEKLSSYPYTKLVVSNNAGEVREFKYELFKDNIDPQTGLPVTGHEIQFTMWGVRITEPFIICFPQNYRGIVNDFDNGLTMSNFPQCAWSGDTFKTWWAQNKNQFAVGLISNAIAGVAAGASGAVIGGSLINNATSDLGGFQSVWNPYTGPGAFGADTQMLGREYGMYVAGTQKIASTGQSVISSASNIAMSLAKVQDIKNMPNLTHGAAQTATLNSAYDRYRFDFYEMKIKKEFAIIIDRYFSLYGYKTNKVKTPNRDVRKKWCYTKTIGCQIESAPYKDQAGNTVYEGVYQSGVLVNRRVVYRNIPSDAARAIEKIYDKGIRFWKKDYADYIGQYNTLGWDNPTV